MRFWIVLFVPIAALAASPELSVPVVIKQAINLTSQRQFDQAESLLKETLDRAKHQNLTDWIAPILNDLGTVAQERGRFFEAERYYKESVGQANEDGGDTSAGKASPLGNLGSLYYEAGLYSRAIDYMSQSLDVLHENKIQGTMLAKALNNMGVVYLAQHKDAVAESSAQDALKIWLTEEGPDGPNTAFSYALLGAALNHAGRADEAEGPLQKALEIWTKRYGPEDIRTAKGNANLGAFYFDRGQLAKAGAYFDKARPVFQEAGLNDRFVLHFLQVDAVLQKKLGNDREAKNLRQEHDRMEAATPTASMTANVVDVSGFLSGK